MRQINYERRRSRGGKKLIPPNPSQWDNEHWALDLRDELGVAPAMPLDCGEAFALLPEVGVYPHGEVPAAEVYLDHLRADGASRWSGMALPLPNGITLVLYNDSHPRTRIRATLMEEFFHLWLEHPPSLIRVYQDGEGERIYDPAIEDEAYACGAAALVPYQALRSMVHAGKPVEVIAEHFEVSRELVLFRAKVTKLYSQVVQTA